MGGEIINENERKKHCCIDGIHRDRNSIYKPTR